MSGAIPKELRLDHPDLDRQHGELFGLLESAAAAFDLGDRAELLTALARFTEALLTHTAEEDRLMEASLFPDRGRHRQAHELFLADLERLRLEVEAGGATPVVDEWLRLRVPEWLRFHVAVNDTKVAQHLATHRATPSRAARRPARRPS